MTESQKRSFLLESTGKENLGLHTGYGEGMRNTLPLQASQKEKAKTMIVSFLNTRFVY